MQAVRMGQATLKLTFVAGPLEGRAIDVPIGTALSIGAQAGLDLSIVGDDRVSPTHAMLTTDDTGIWLEDCGSDYGTYVNGERITRRRLTREDRVLIGSSVIDLMVEGREPGGLVAQSYWLFESGARRGHVLALDQGTFVLGRSEVAADVWLDDVHVARRHAIVTVGSARVTVEDLDAMSATRLGGEPISGVVDVAVGALLELGETQLRLVNFTKAGVATLDHAVTGLDLAAISASGVLAGLLDQIGLPEVLQVLGRSRRTGCLLVRGADGGEGRVFVRQGRVDGVLFEAATAASDAATMQRAFETLVGWSSGSFHFDPLLVQIFEHPLDAPVERLLMDALATADAE